MMNRALYSSLFSLKFHPKVWFLVRWIVLVVIIFFLLSQYVLGVMGLFVLGAVILFFRDPDRFCIDDSASIISPADGMIVEISSCAPPPEFSTAKEGWTKIGIFMAPWNVHVNRIPCDGTIIQKVYKPGSFYHVATAKVSPTNERLGIMIRHPEGHEVLCVQIAGFLARRIICDTECGETVRHGDRYGIICFSSHVDVYLPSSHVKLLVIEGQHVRSGETPLALFT